jgi:acyl-CoA hydrolase
VQQVSGPKIAQLARTPVTNVTVGGASVTSTAIPATAKSGKIFRIVPMLDPGAGVVTSRGSVHYVVTEYGVAYLHGRTIRQRAESLIEIAHHKFREELYAYCERLGGCSDPRWPNLKVSQTLMASPNVLK